jgi:hypothetical protein
MGPDLGEKREVSALAIEGIGKAGKGRAVGVRYAVSLSLSLQYLPEGSSERDRECDFVGEEGRAQMSHWDKL